MDILIKCILVKKREDWLLMIMLFYFNWEMMENLVKMLLFKWFNIFNLSWIMNLKK